MNFSNILNASIAASWTVLAVIALRFLLKKAPRWIHVALWGLVAVRLLLPFSIESSLSLIPSAETIPHEILQVEGTQLQEPAYLDVVSDPIFTNGASVEIGQTIDRVQIHMIVMTLIWLIGIAVLLIYTITSYWYLRRKVNEAVILRDNIFQSENAGSPFVLGIIKPRIYLPYKIEEQTFVHVIAHEQAHIQRKDHWWKPLGFLLLTIHWFNPLMWLGYVLLCRDIELACDEKAIKDIDNEQRADYFQALEACSVKHPMIAACPLAFGEVGVKERVKSVLNYKKPAFWIIAVAVVACIVVGVCFMTNPKTTLKIEELGITHYWYSDSPQKAEVTVTDPQTLSTFSELLNYDGRNWNDDITKLEPEEYFVLELNDDLRLHINLLREDTWYMDEVKNGQFIHETSVDAEVVDALMEMLSENDISEAQMSENSPGTEKKKSDNNILTDAPELTVETADQNITAMQGTTSWMYHVEGDTWSGLETDSMHPLDNNSREIIPVLRYNTLSTNKRMKPNDANLLFDPVPDSVTVRCWDEKYWGNPEENDNKAELLPYKGYNFCIELKDGGYIYEVIAEWNSNPKYNGTARYSFYAAPDATGEIDRIDNYAGPAIPSDTANLITVRSSGKTIHPFLHFAYGSEWTDYGFIDADGTPIDGELTEWTGATYLPALVYSDDFAVSYADGVSFRYIIPFDESMQQMDNLFGVTELANLKPGKYYIGIVITQEGDYIEQAKQSEYTGWACLFRLTVE